MRRSIFSYSTSIQCLNQTSLIGLFHSRTLMDTRTWFLLTQAFRTLSHQAFLRISSAQPLCLSGLKSTTSNQRQLRVSTTVPLNQHSYRNVGYSSQNPE